MRTRVRCLRPCRSTSWAAANGIRWVKPSMATQSPSRTLAATASAREQKTAMKRAVARQSVPERLDLLQQLFTAIGKERWNLHRGAKLLVGLVHQKSLGLGDRRFKQRATGRAHIHGIEVAAILHLRDIGKAESLEVELDLALRLMIVDLEGHVMRHAFAVAPAAGGHLRFHAKFNHGPAAAIADLVAKMPAIGPDTASIPAALHELFGVVCIADRDDDSVGTAQSMLLRHRTIAVRL